ncbi:MAG: response regulator [Acidobacteria bacterium]|nr:response regulator [Acidobacteriota bacterium]MBU4330500.1 response regulator [Acidobacteriota bacterium]MBU4495996.1 response regulator [Acidobacteriota bacterium]MCG2815174.1 response regulator [Candidatus Aminicenantes bacterium]
MRKVVVIEDDKVTLRLIEKILMDEGFEVLTALDGRVGLDLVQTYLPGLVISDMLIPSIDGMELTKRIRSNSLLKNIPVILISAVYKGYTFKRDIEESGADHFMAKPLNMPELLRIAKEILKES